MAKVPEDERILEILRRGGYDVSDDWAWVRHYLELADKCLNVAKETPRETASPKVVEITRDQQAARPSGQRDGEAANAESMPPEPRRKSA
jgi:hypothetical protein